MSAVSPRSRDQFQWLLGIDHLCPDSPLWFEFSGTDGVHPESSPVS